MQTLPLIVHVGMALLGLAYLLPGHYLPWLSFQAQWLSAFAVALIAGGLALRPVANRLPVPKLAWLALALSVIPPLQHMFGLIHFRSDAVLASLYLLALALSIVAGAAPEGRDATAVLRCLLMALLMTGTIAVALALVQWLQLGSFAFIADLRPGDRPFGNLAQPNHLATLLSLGVVAVLYLFQAGRLGAAGSVALLAWLGLGLVMTQSRTGWLSMALLAAWCLIRDRTQGLRVRRRAVVLSLALFAAGVWVWEPLNEWLLLTTVSLQERMSPGTRWLHWRVLWDALWMEPWIGYGWQQVALAQQRGALLHPASMEMLQNSHNVLLDLLIWNGAPVGVLVSVAVFWWFGKRVRASTSVERFALVAAVGVVGTHALLEYPLDHAYFLLPFGLLLGLLDAPPRQRLVLPRFLFGAALSGMLVALFLIGVEYLKVEQANRDVRLMLAGYGLDKVPNVPPPDVRLLDGPREYHRFMITQARPGMSADELDWMQRVVQRNAYPPAMFRLALAEGLNGRVDEASLTLNWLCRIHIAERCDEAREGWRAARQQYPVLQAVEVP